MTKKTDVQTRQKEYLMPAISTFYEDPLVIEKGDGATITDVEGNTYHDFFGGILTVSVGHAHPEVNAAIKEQIDKVTHTSTLYETAPQVDLAEKLAEMTPGDLKQSFFTNSGTEANETAIAIAELKTGSTEVIALRHSYSGRSHLAMGLTGNSGYRLTPSLPGVKHLASPYCYRCPFGLTYPSCELRCAKDAKELIETTTTGHVAAMIAEPIQGVGGFVTPPPEYFQEVVPIVRDHGGLFICDEVQTGFGRTGTDFGIEHYGVQPDIMTFAKGLANGLPIGATIAREDVAAAYRGGTIATFGGNPVSTAAALATLRVMEREDVKGRARDIGGLLRQGLEDLQKRFPVIGDVRGKGFMQALEIVRDPKTKEPAPDIVLRLFESTRRHGLLIGKGGTYANVIRIAPPMLVSRAAVLEAVKILGVAFEEVTEGKAVASAS